MSGHDDTAVDTVKSEHETALETKAPDGPSPEMQERIGKLLVELHDLEVAAAKEGHTLVDVLKVAGQQFLGIFR